MMQNAVKATFQGGIPTRGAELELIDTLPKQALAKMLYLREGALAAYAKVQNISQDIRRLRPELDNCVLQRSRLFETNFRIATDDPLVIAEDAKISRLQAEIDRLLNLNAEREREATTIGHLLDGCERFIRDHSGDFVVAAPVLDFKLKSESPLEAVQRHRRRIRELVADTHAIEAAPILSSEAKERAKKQIMDLAAAGRPDCFGLVETGGEIRWPETVSEMGGSTVKGDFAMLAIDYPNSLAMLAWLHQDAMLQAINREIDSIADDSSALAAQQRIERRNQALADRLHAERCEESVIELAEREGGVIIPRRSDADPRAVLGIV